MMINYKELQKNGVNLITPEGYQKLYDESKHLVSVARPKIVDEVHWAAAQGDRSENAEYIYGKKKLREIDRRLRFLQSRLESARVVPAAQQMTDIVGFGAQVEIELESGETRTYKIVGEDEADPTQMKISWKSPYGKALLNKKKEDSVMVKTPQGEIELYIKSFSY